MSGLGLKKLGVNIVLALGRQVTSGLLQLVSLIVIARTFGPEGNGAYVLALLLPTLLATFLNFGISPANVYYLGSKQVSPLTAWHSTLKIYVLTSITGMLIGSGIVYIYSEKWFSGVPDILLWLSLAIYPISLLLNLISSLFQGLQHFRQFNLILIIQPLLTLIGILLIILLNIKDIVWVLSAHIIASLVTLVCSIILLKPCLVDDPTLAFRNYAKAAIGYGYKAHISNILGFLNYKADLFLVNFFIGPVGVGIYTVAVQLAERLWLLSQAVSTVLLPRLSELSSDEEKRKLLTPLISRWVLFVTFFAALLLAAVASYFIQLVFGDEFKESLNVLYWLLPGVVLVSASRILANDIAARGRPELNMYTSWFVVVINVIGNIWLIPRYGVDGAAMASSFSYAIHFILRIFMYQHFTLIPALSVIFVRPEDWYLIRTVLHKFSKPQVE